MKKVMLFIVLLLLPVIAFCQDVPPPPDNWGDVLVNFKTWFASFGGIAVLTAFLAAFANGIMQVEKKFLKQLVAWVIAIILLVVADLLNFGYVAQYPILLAVIHGFAAGLASNGIFDVPWFKTILDYIEKLFKKTP